MREALFQLGYYDVYHGVAAIHENPRDCEMWLDAYKACKDGQGTFGRKEWDQLLGHCMVMLSPFSSGCPSSCRFLGRNGRPLRFVCERTHRSLSGRESCPYHS